MDHFCYLWVVFVMYLCLFIVALYCGHLLERADLLARLYVKFSFVLLLSHVLSWVRCGP